MLAIERASFRDPWSCRQLQEDPTDVALDAGTLVGFLVWRTLFQGDDPGSAEYEILNLAVDPSRRRQGIARQLLRHRLATAGSFTLEVRETNTAAQGLYQTFGFVQIGVRPNYYRLPTEPAIVMKLKRC